MSATLGAALKKIAVALLSDHRNWEKIAVALFAVLLLFLLPILSVEAIFQADMDWNSPELVSAVMEELDVGSLGFLESSNSVLTQLQEALKAAGFGFDEFRKAQALYWLALSPYAEEDDFVQKLVGCFAPEQTNEELVANVNAAFGTDIDPEDFEKILATTERVKMIYVIPDFQNPTGRTWDLERRHQFMEIVNRYEIPVIEDNPYGELRFEGEYLPALKSLDTKGLVIYLGTFSKILAPGYRIGWVCAEEHILAKYNFMEQAASLQASTIGQMETSKWIDMFDLDAHVATIRACYDKRRKVMLETLERELPEGCTFTHPVGGLFAWVVLPEYMDAKELQMKCLEKKVAFVPGGSFFPNGNHENTLRLNYSCMPEEKIVQGITALCQTIRENLR